MSEYSDYGIEAESDPFHLFMGYFDLLMKN